MFMKMNNLLHECGYVYEKKLAYLKSQVENRVRVQFDVEAAELVPILSGCRPLARFSRRHNFKAHHDRKQRWGRAAKTARVLSFMRFNPPVEGKVGINPRCTARGPYNSNWTTTRVRDYFPCANTSARISGIPGFHRCS
jgi:hypothetical protein